MADAVTVGDAVHRHEKKHKKHKDRSAKSEKKRSREEDDTLDAERSHKKSKSIATENLDAVNGDGELKEKKKKKKDKKDRKRHEEEEEDDGQLTTAPAGEAEGERKKKKKHRKHHDESEHAVGESTSEMLPAKDAHDAERKKKKKKKHAHDEDEALPDANGLHDEHSERKDKKKKKKSKKHDEDAEEPALVQTEIQSAEPDADAMIIDDVQPTKSSKRSKIYQPPDIPSDPQFPFFTQTVSLYEPLYPIGWSEPITACQQQHLRHLQNRYVPSLRGVLLDYRNVSFGENAGRAGAATEDDEVTQVKSRNEYAVGFGWLTADLDLFVPSRGAWMEGSVNLQTEGHIGVVCFGRFNASIEARRLPSDWEWVPSDSDPNFEDTASLITADDHGVIRQLHSTGYWVDGSGDKVKGKIRFRIRNFDVGMTGETSYLSLEGTMLDKAAEKELVAEEAERMRARKAKRGALLYKRERKMIPEFAVTKFAVDADADAQMTQNEPQDLEIGEGVDDKIVPNRMTTDD